MPTSDMTRFKAVTEALEAAKQAVHDLEGARYLLLADPLTSAEASELNTLTTSASQQLTNAITRLA